MADAAGAEVGVEQVPSPVISLHATPEEVAREVRHEREQHQRVMEIVGGPGGISIAALKEFWAYREVLTAFVMRMVKVKYKQAIVGIGWAVVQPLVSALMFTFFLGKLIKAPSEGVPYLLFALAGMVLWTFFAGAVSGAMESLISDQTLIRKVFFPREILPIANILAGVVDFVPGLVILGVVAALFGYWPSLSWIALPIPLFLVFIAAAGLGMGLSSLNVYYRDVRYVLPFVLQLGLFASPVVYPLSKIPAGWRTLYAVANPVATAIDDVRRIVLHHGWPDWSTTTMAFIWAVVLLVGSYSLFKRLERGFADRI